VVETSEVSERCSVSSVSGASRPRTARRVVEEARRLDNFVRIDMEDSFHTDATLAVFRKLHQEFENVGLVLQAYLFRTHADLEALLAESTRIRLSKGAYKEPPDKAFPRKADVDANYQGKEVIGLWQS